MAKNKPTEEALRVLKECTVEGNNVKLPEGQLARPLYEEVKKHLELIGGVWKGGKTQAFVFEYDPTDLLAAQANGEGKDLKKEYQFFPTPSQVAAFMLKHLPAVTPETRFLEPEAGRGDLVKALRLMYPEAQVECFELMDINRSFLDKEPGVALFAEPDFLKAVASDQELPEKYLQNRYDVIIANPPFTNNQDIDHIRSMFYCLKPGGTLISLASPSWTNGQNRKQTDFKDWLNYLNAISKPLEAGSFKESGTNIAPVLLVIEKPASPVQKGDSPVPQTTEQAPPPARKAAAAKHEITIEYRSLMKALKKLKGVVVDKPVLAVLGDILVKVQGDQIQMLTTDLEVTLIAALECVNPSGSDFTVLIPFEFIYKFTELSVSDITLKVSGDKAMVSTHAANCNLGVLNNIADFPELPVMPKDHSIILDGELVGWMSKAFDTVSKDVLRPSMCCVCLDITDKGMTMVSTNAHSLFTKTFEVTSDKATQLLITKKVAKALAGFEETTIYWGDNHAVFTADNITVVARRVDAAYPNYKAVIPEHKANLELNRNDLIAALKKSDLTSGEGHMATFYLKSKIGILDLKSKDHDNDRESTIEIAGDYTGDCEKISVSPATALNLLQQVDYETLNISVQTSTSPILFRTPEDTNYLSLMMPVMTDN